MEREAQNSHTLKREDAGGGRPHPPVLAGVRAVLRLLFVAVLALFAWYLFSGITRVAPGEVALVERFGRLASTPEPPGLLLAWPPPVDRVIRIPGQQILEIELNEWAPRQAADEGGDAGGVISRAALHPVRDGYSLTGDRNIVQGRFVVRYRVVDPLAFYLRSMNPEFGLQSFVYRSIVRALASKPVDEVLVEERGRVAAEIMGEVQEQVDAVGLGVEVLAVEIRELVPPLWVISAFEEVVNAQVEAETFVEQALNEAANDLPMAEAEAFRLRGEAEIEAENLVRRAQASAESFRRILAEAQNDPEAFTMRFHAEALGAILGRLRVKNLLPESAAEGMRLLLPGVPPGALDAGLPALPSTPLAPLDMEALEE